MNKGIAQVERAEKAEREAKSELPHALTQMQDQCAKKGVCDIYGADGWTVARTHTDAPNFAAELVKRWNAYPRLMEALKTIESKLHEGDEEDGSDDGEYIQDVRNLSGDYIGQLQDLGTIARGAIAVAAQ